VLVRPHWEAVYAGGDAAVSWLQDRPAPSLNAIAALGLPPEAPILDVGGGSSGLAGALLAAGHADLTVLDLSAAALALARGRLGDRGDRVTWIAADLLAWTPPRRYALWHDRALLHFFTGEAERAAYASRVRAAVAPGGFAVVATFAPDGPETCSGLPVRRSDAAGTLRLLGDGFREVRSWRLEHTTPGGRAQPFAWLVAQRD
jgi:trans-aconitate methyltransferase